jgi:RES domain-containing protein
VVTAWRIVKNQYAEDAFTGLASARRGGRWNPPGMPVVYTSGGAALAALELLAHIESDVANDFVIISCSFHDVLVETVADLPENWSAVPPPPELQQICHAWATSRYSAVLQVPSAVVPMEFNYLLNPEHPDLHSIDVGKPMPFRLDYRLLT